MDEDDLADRRFLNIVRTKKAAAIVELLLTWLKGLLISGVIAI